MTPSETLQQLLSDHNLSLSLSPLMIKRVEDGSIIIAPQTLIVNFIQQPLEPTAIPSETPEETNETPSVEEVTQEKGEMNGPEQSQPETTEATTSPDGHGADGRSA